MSVVVNFDLPADAFVLGKILSDVDDYSVQLTQFVPTGGQFIPYFWIESKTMAAVEPTLRAHPRITKLTTFDERAGRTLCQIEWARPLDEFLQIPLEKDILVISAHGTPERWQFELLANDRDGLAEFHSACIDNDVPIEIRQLFQSGSSPIDRIGLTDKQSEMLRLAHERGYFGVPRQVTVTELAEQLSISPQAASKRLRRGLENVVEFALGGT